MAVNSFNPRLFSSSSSENDLDDVFRHKGGATVAPVGASVPTSKSRCFSEPVYQNGKEGKKEDVKVFGKTPALSDSSNVLRRQRGRVVTLPGCENPDEGKVDCSTIVEENSQLMSPGSSDADKFVTSTDSVFPEPESNREASRDAYKFSLVSEEEEESLDAVMPNLGRGQEFGGTGLLELDNELDDQMREVNDQDFYMRDVAFGSYGTESQQNLDDDDSYPEKEYFPSNYEAYAAQDPPYSMYPWDVPRAVLRSCDLDSELELPDDLFKETAVYPDLMKHYDNLDPANVPSPITPVDYEVRMKLFVGEDC